MEEGVIVIDNTEESDLVWYDIKIAGKQFNISSRRGEEYIRSIERLMEQTRVEMKEQLQEQGPTNSALLIALNLADQFLSLKTVLTGGEYQWDQRLEGLVEKLDKALPGNGVYEEMEKKGTSAMYEKLEFF